MALVISASRIPKIAKPALLPTDVLDIDTGVVKQIVSIMLECNAIRLPKQTMHDVQLEAIYIDARGSATRIFDQLQREGDTARVMLARDDTLESEMQALYTRMAVAINAMNTQWYDIYDRMYAYRNVVV